jgi:uncharacterized protein
MNLLEAIQAGDATRVASLLEADPAAAEARTPEGVSYVSMAMYHRQRDIARMIATRKKQLDLHEACAVGDPQRVAQILESDPGAGNSLSPDGFPPIALAAFFGHAELVALLALKGVDVNAPAQNPMKVAAIHAAVAARDARSVAILLQNGADPNLRQQNEYTPLMAAEQNGDAEIVSMLKEHGAR